MSTINNLLKECLLDSIMAEIHQIEELNYSHITASENFNKKIKNIITAKSKKSLSPKKVVVILVAAILASLSIMFSVSAQLRQRAVDFFVEIYDTFAELVIIDKNDEVTNTENTDSSKTDSSEPQQSSYPTSIETVYLPSYINSNNFFELDMVVNTFMTMGVWSNGEAIIDLTQSVVDSTTSLDIENANHEVDYIGDKKVYFTLKNGIYTVSWLEYGYLFVMTCDEHLGWDEVEKIVSSLECYVD